jgi:hypothetical protein
MMQLNSVLVAGKGIYFNSRKLFVALGLDR